MPVEASSTARRLGEIPELIGAEIDRGKRSHEAMELEGTESKKAECVPSWNYRNW